MQQNQAPQRGYLHEEYRLFHLKDKAMEQVDWHYHDFHKILIFLGGHASYAIEGQSYDLEPGDLVLVPRGCIHKPEVREEFPYERYVLYLSPAFLERASDETTDLETCFQQAIRHYSFALRPARLTALIRLLGQVEEAHKETAFGGHLLGRSLLIQFLIQVTRAMEGQDMGYVTSAACDEKILSILKYLNLHLTEPFSIEELSRQFYISKYYMMRRFKAETGYTIHNYLTEKRLLLAREKILHGLPLGLVSQECGFGDYSSFSRAYKKRFGVSPNVPITEETDLTLVDWV